MKLFSVMMLMSAMVVSLMNVGLAGAPVDLTKIATPEQLKAEITAQMKAVDELVKEGKFGEKAAALKQAAGVVAVMSQGVAELSAADAPKAVALRDAAIKIWQTKEEADLKTAAADLQKTYTTEATSTAEVAHPWNKLTKMGGMMEEINTRNSKLRRAIRRPKGDVDEQLHAITCAMLTVAMYADTHEVKDKAKVPEWEKMSVDYIEALKTLTKALADKDSKTAEEAYKVANESCEKCHEVFRDE